MRVAVAGTNTLALLIAHFVVSETSHQLVILSRRAQPQLTAQGYQVLVVDYNDEHSLKHAVTGVHTVISTVTGGPELELLKACVAQNVRRFAPAEFEGRPVVRPAHDPLDRGKKTILDWLDFYRSRIESTVFVCGVLYERFGPGGLAQHQLGLQTNLCNEGDFIVNVRSMTLAAPVYDINHQTTVTICMIAAQDAARLVVRALDSPNWQRELLMAGERMTVLELTQVVERVRGTPFSAITWYYPASLQSELQYAQIAGDVPQEMRVHDLIATVNGRYDFPFPGNLRESHLTRDIRPITFETWLRNVWGNIVPVVPST
ncbi:NAD(P)-binding protein [Tothia fuscella]|uniref:NAD(P)-binding protein n=1 Tax=Tothia fuscella TaxID=1048955 RepID=A0A9P4NWK7_9PEZI|nr:NAD(P)-binding protein [Tothia fuscella]